MYGPTGAPSKLGDQLRAHLLKERQPDTGEWRRGAFDGALKRRLMLRLSGCRRRSGVGIVRGAEQLAPRGLADQPLTQRLDVGEHVVWSAQPRQEFRRYLPKGQREWGLLAIALFLFAGAGRMASGAYPALRLVNDGGMPVQSLAFITLAFGVGSTILLLLGIAGSWCTKRSCAAGPSSHTRFWSRTARLIQRRLRSTPRSPKDLD